MLVGALAVTVVGFILLVLALALSSAWLAWACIVVCVIGFGLLIADVLGMRKPAAETAAPQQQADYPPEPAAQPEAGAAAAPEAEQTAVVVEAAEPQDVAQVDTAKAVSAHEPASAEEPAVPAEPEEATQVVDEGADEQTDRAE